MFATLLETSAVLWAVVLLVGAIDGVYYHLWKFRLFERRETRIEHLAHTIRACLLTPLLVVGFVVQDLRTSARLWVLLALMGSDLIAGICDAVLERKTRAHTNGLPHSEYLVHVGVTGAHGAAEAFLIAGWLVASESGAEARLSVPFASSLALLLAFGSAFAAAVHLLLLHPRFARS